MTARKASVSATGGRMINPSVEPTARRESERVRRESTGKFVARDTLDNQTADYNDDYDDSSGGRNGATLLDESESMVSVSAFEARNQRRSICLKRLNLNDHINETLLHALEGVVLDAGLSVETAVGSEKLQVIMTQAKEKGFELSKLFRFFLLESEKGSHRRSSKSAVENQSCFPEPVPEEPKEPGGHLAFSGEANGSSAGIFKDTATSKIRVEASRFSNVNVKRSMDRMPSLKNTKRPSTASSKRGSGSVSHSSTARYSIGKEDDVVSTSGEGVSAALAGSRRSKSRRLSGEEDAMMRDRLVTSDSFHQGLASLGFKLTDEESTTMFRYLDGKGEGRVDLSELAKFCLQIPSMAWKAERARRGIICGNSVVDSTRELNKAAHEIAIETVNAHDGEGGVLAADSVGGGGSAVESPIELGKIVFKGEKFFWRTKDLIEVVIQLNAEKGLLAINTFHTDTLEVYPIIFVDPAKIPINNAAIAMHTKMLEDQRLEAKRAVQREMAGTDNTSDVTKEEVIIIESEEQTLAEKAHMMCIADYLLHRLNMPDQNGNLLQPDVTQPGVKINPALPPDDLLGKVEPKKVVAKRSPGLMKTILDEWETLLIPNPPAIVFGAPEFSKTRRRESYFQEFVSKKGEFDENRVKARRLSNEAEAYSKEVSRLLMKLAPLNYSASAPAILRDEHVIAPTEPLASAEMTIGHRGGSKVILDDGLSQGIVATRRESTRNSLLESQSAPILLTQEGAVA